MLGKIKVYSAANDESISQLVEKYFKRMVEKDNKPSLLDVLDSLPRSKSSFPWEFDFRKEYFKERKKRYGF